MISQVYGGGGNAGATYRNDFIELFNLGTSTVNVTGWSVQYAASTGTTWLKTDLSGWIKPGRYYLVQEAAGTGGTTNLPTPHAIGTIAMALGAGKVALLNTNVLTTGGTVCPSGSSVVDIVGYGPATTCSETTPTAATSNTTAAIRKSGGAQDTDNNNADFTVGAPTPRATADYQITVASTTPAGANVPLNTNIGITFSEPATVTGTWFTITCPTSGAHTAAVSGGPTTFTLDPATDFAGNETCTVTVLAAQVADQDSDDPPDQMAANFVFTFTTLSPPVKIREIQDSAHISPKNGQLVGGVAGVVTGKTSNGFWMQDPSPDANPATSEGIFVFSTTGAASVAVGDAVTVSGRVSEFRPGTAGLTITELTSPTIVVSSSGNVLPPAIVIGTDRTPPTEVIEDDATGDVETSGVFDPASDGIDFWESLEGMRVDLGFVVVTGPSPFDELGVLANNGAGATSRTARGGIVITATDKNPEKILMRGVGFNMPDSNTGDHFTAPIVGIVGYDFNNFMLEVLTPPTRVADGVTREVTVAPAPNELTIATFNVENLDPGDPTFATMANLIVNNLRSPDVISLEEIQDNDGETNSGIVDASVTLTKLRDAVIAAGGPTYEWRQIDPVNLQDGGAPGGNIRQAFFFRTDRG
ncbi:MAG: lamin tail domain-containing protein, partial [Chloroflexota bacterium]|nr:lamin tail domain-containing protein [Chloroflexota bacterium]